MNLKSCLGAFLVGILLGAGGVYFYHTHVPEASEQREYHSNSNTGNKHYSFINPLLECDIGDRISEQILQPLKPSVETVLNEFKESKKVTEAAIYYRDLNNGPWFGINEREKFIPASLLKVPTFIAALNQMENDPKLGDKMIEYDGGFVQNTQYYKPLGAYDHLF
jgi:hypothetical protein